MTKAEYIGLEGVFGRVLYYFSEGMMAEMSQARQFFLRESIEASNELVRY